MLVSEEVIASPKNNSMIPIDQYQIHSFAIKSLDLAMSQSRQKSPKKNANTTTPRTPNTGRFGLFKVGLLNFSDWKQVINKNDNCSICQLSEGMLFRYCKCDLYMHETCLYKQLMKKFDILKEAAFSCQICDTDYQFHSELRQLFILQRYKHSIDKPILVHALISFIDLVVMIICAILIVKCIQNQRRIILIIVLSVIIVICVIVQLTIVLKLRFYLRVLIWNLVPLQFDHLPPRQTVTTIDMLPFIKGNRHQYQYSQFELQQEQQKPILNFISSLNSNEDNLQST